MWLRVAFENLRVRNATLSLRVRWLRLSKPHSKGEKDRKP
jgi:hypothetical protein